MSGKSVQASTVNNEDGSITMSGFAGLYTVDLVECDWCERDFPPADRWIGWAWAPGSHYWAEVMWSCPVCGADGVGTMHPDVQPDDMYDRDTEWSV